MTRSRTFKSPVLCRLLISRGFVGVFAAQEQLNPSQSFASTHPADCHSELQRQPLIFTHPCNFIFLPALGHKAEASPWIFLGSTEAGLLSTNHQAAFWPRVFLLGDALVWGSYRLAVLPWSSSPLISWAPRCPGCLSRTRRSDTRACIVQSRRPCDTTGSP